VVDGVKTPHWAAGGSVPLRPSFTQVLPHFTQVLQYYTQVLTQIFPSLHSKTQRHKSSHKENRRGHIPGTSVCSGYIISKYTFYKCQSQKLHLSQVAPLLAAIHTSLAAIHTSLAAFHTSLAAFHTSLAAIHRQRGSPFRLRRGL
jgi:hypothetical protein